MCHSVDLTPARARMAPRMYQIKIPWGNDRRANRSRSGRSSLRRGNLINVPAIPLRPSSRKRPITDFEQTIGDVNFGNRGRRRSGGRRRRHDGFWLWERSMVPEPAEEPLPGTVRAWVSRSASRRGCASGIVPRCRPERLREPLCDLPSTRAATAECREVDPIGGASGASLLIGSAAAPTS